MAKMAVKRLNLDEIGEVCFYKRRGTRSIHIYIRGNEIHVTLPYWVTYNRAIDFAYTKKDWIIKNRKPKAIFSDGCRIGKTHTLQVETNNETKTVSCRVTESCIKVKLPSKRSHYENFIQQKINNAADRALLKQSRILLKQRIDDLSFEHDIEYKSVKFKKLRGRWGSCDNYGNVTLNIYLIQLPWYLIDYVIVHELAHTIHHNHSQQFWQLVADILPDYKQTKKEIKQFHPHIIVS